MMLLLCECEQARVLSPVNVQALHAAAAAAGLPVRRVGDLCRLAAGRDARLQEVAAAPRVVVAACFPRAVRWLFHAAGYPLAEERVSFVDLRGGAPEAIAGAVAAAAASAPAGEAQAAATGAGASIAPELPPDWVPWFPVIDHARCRNCMQCLNFCLFGVYGKDAAGRVAVQQPHHCKTNCPACARICPEIAIMFPKYGQAPLNGEAVTDEAAQRDRVRVDVQQLLGDDVYTALKKRRARRLYRE